MALAYYRDPTTGAPAPLWGSDLNKAIADTLYVAKAGDSMQGALTMAMASGGVSAKIVNRHGGIAVYDEPETALLPISCRDPSNDYHAVPMGYMKAAAGNKRQVIVQSATVGLGISPYVDYVYVCNPAGSITLTLPTAVGSKNLYTIKRTSTGAVTVATTGGQTIDGQATFVIDVQWMAIDLVSDGTNWVVI